MGNPSSQMLNAAPDEAHLWEQIAAHAGETFRTARGLEFIYKVQGGTMTFNRKSKEVTFSTVMLAYHTAVSVQQEQGFVKGPKKLGAFGASYLYPIFIQLGIICPEHREN